MVYLLTKFSPCAFINIALLCFSTNNVLGTEDIIITAESFTLIGKISKTFYYISHVNDVRGVADARVGCHDSFHNGGLVALETIEEHNEVRRQLSTMGITDDIQIWTTGEHDIDTEDWIWYDYHNGVSYTVDINACEMHLWKNNTCPDEGCIAVGGRDLTYKWQAENCTTRLRYLCELYREEEEELDNPPDTCGQPISTQLNCILIVIAIVTNNAINLYLKS